METSLLRSESKFLERSRIALVNAEKNSAIKAVLAEYGINAAKFAEGWTIFHNTNVLWNLKKYDDVENKRASILYKRNYAIMQDIYSEHREKVRIFFKKRPDMLIRLGVDGVFPVKYTDFFEKVELFYTEINNNESIQKELNKIKIDAMVVCLCLGRFNALLAERAYYDKELGEAQDVTKSKNAALLEFKEWMEDFYATVEVALYDRPQLLETVGVFVMS